MRAKDLINQVNIFVKSSGSSEKLPNSPSARLRSEKKAHELLLVFYFRNFSRRQNRRGGWLVVICDTAGVSEVENGPLVT